MSVFAGCAIEAVETVAAGLDDVARIELDALDGLGSLLDKSLIRQLDSAEGDREPRIVMLETIREFAAERLDAQAALAAAVKDHHARYFGQYAADATQAAAGADGEV